MTALALSAPLVDHHAVPAMRLGRWRLTQVSICVAVAALPLLRPAGPGNTGLVDLALLAAMMISALWASTRSHQIQLPYAMAVGLTVLAGAAAVTVGGSLGDAGEGIAANSSLALVQDIFVFGWAASVATLGQDHQLLDVFCRAWAYSATAWAALLIVGEILGIAAITGISARDGIRASLTLGDPNLAADYFLVALLVIRATRRPRRTLWRWLACALVVTAIVLTLSNGGILALFVATAAGVLFRVTRQRGLGAAVVLGAVLALGGALAYTTIDLHTWVTSVEEKSPFIRDSLGREAESGGSRTTIAKESVALWLRGDTIWGLGPGNTEQALRARQAPYVKEAHDDYLASLLERGVLGGFALIVLVGAVAMRARRITVPGGVPPRYLAVVPRPELLCAGLVAVAVSAVFYETLHFRHVWALFGLVAALGPARRAIGRSAP